MRGRESTKAKVKMQNAKLKPEDVARIIDHTLLRVDATRQDIERLCGEAVSYKFYAVCTNPVWVKMVSGLLENTGIKVCSVSGFPLGAMTTEIKVEEAKRGVGDGADEVDMVMNVGAFKDQEYSLVHDEIERIVEAVGKEKVVKVIIETCVLTDEEKRRAAGIVEEAGAGFVKTSTGYSSGGATVSDVRILKEVVGDRIGVKASGGIRTLSQAIGLIKAGATRIGTSSGVGIIEEGSVASTKY